MSAPGSAPIRVLFLGASYGVVLGMRMSLAGHSVTYACREDEAVLINGGRLFLRLPVKEDAPPVEITPTHCPIAPQACTPEQVDTGAFDLVCLAMQEPQYSATGVRELVGRISGSGLPCLSIMNMPLPPYLNQIAPLEAPDAEQIFCEPTLWKGLQPDAFTMASADPQAMRLDSDDAIVIKVTLPTNFKVAPFTQSSHQRLVERLARDIDDSRIEIDGRLLQPRVRLYPHASSVIPVAKWPMLITGNFRCLTDDEPVSIGDAVCANESESRDIYEWVMDVCRAIGVEEQALVPFDRYLAAARGLTLPSSLARGLDAGATAVERIDILIQALGRRFDLRNPELDRIIVDVNDRLERNRGHSHP